MLQVENISFGYQSKKVLKNISFEVKPSTICGLLGPNGSGKSTLFRCCMNFIKAQQGHISVNNKDISALSVKQVAKLIAYVPQEHKQPFPFLVEDMVLMGRTVRMTSFISPQKADKLFVWNILEKIGIEHLAHKAFNTLSGGQRQLVLIARALAQESSLMLLDEPASALDFNNQILLWKLLQELSEEGIAIVVCSHDPNHILWFCHQALILSEGLLIDQGHPHDLLKAHAFEKIYGADFKTIELDNTYMIYPELQIKL